MNLRIFLPSLLACLLVSGCAQFNTAFRTYDGRTDSVMVDVKQRAIISGSRDGKIPVICAEPSPDAMAAYALELAATAKTPQQLSGQAAASSQEGASYVGLRTQSIQLLRDSLYRLCEGYMNGAITQERFDLLARRYQKNMVALLAIEQLTGTVKAPPVTINTQGLSSVAQGVDQLLESQKRLLSQKDAITTELTDLDTKIASYDVALAATPAPSADDAKSLTDKKASAVKRRDSLKATLATTESALKLHEEAVRNPGGLAAGGLTSAQVVADSSAARNNESILAVAKTVERIVNNIINGDDAEQMCIDFLSKRYSAVASVAPLVSLLAGKSPSEQDRITQGEAAGQKLQEFCIVVLERSLQKQ